MRGQIVKGNVHTKNGRCYTKKMIDSNDSNVERLKDKFEKLELANVTRSPKGAGVMLPGVVRKISKPKYITAKF